MTVLSKKMVTISLVQFRPLGNKQLPHLIVSTRFEHSFVRCDHDWSMQSLLSQLAVHAVASRCNFKIQATDLRRDTEQQDDSLSAKKSVIPAWIPESSHTDVKRSLA